MTDTQFESNDKVRVKMTDLGRAKFAEGFANYVAQTGKPAPALREDDDGWSKWFYSDLVKRIGDVSTMQNDAPLYTEIEIFYDEPVVTKPSAFSKVFPIVLGALVVVAGLAIYLTSGVK